MVRKIQQPATRVIKNNRNGGVLNGNNYAPNFLIAPSPPKKKITAIHPPSAGRQRYNRARRATAAAAVFFLFNCFMQILRRRVAEKLILPMLYMLYVYKYIYIYTARSGFAATFYPVREYIAGTYISVYTAPRKVSQAPKLCIYIYIGTTRAFRFGFFLRPAVICILIGRNVVRYIFYVRVSCRIIVTVLFWRQYCSGACANLTARGDRTVYIHTYTEIPRRRYNNIIIRVYRCRRCRRNGRVIILSDLKKTATRGTVFAVSRDGFISRRARFSVNRVPRQKDRAAGNARFSAPRA